MAAAAKNDVCPVCLEAITPHSDDELNLACAHALHPMCLQKWFDHDLEAHGTQSCPLCRVGVLDVEARTLPWVCDVCHTADSIQVRRTQLKNYKTGPRKQANHIICFD